MEDCKFMGIIPIFSELQIDIEKEAEPYCESAAFQNAIRCFSLGFWGDIPVAEWVVNDELFVEDGPVRAKYRMEDGATLMILLEPGHRKAHAFRLEEREDGNG